MVFEKLTNNSNEQINRDIEKLTKILHTYQINENRICIHFHLKNSVVRNCVNLEEIEINNQGVYLTGNDFVLNIERKIQKIIFSDYEESANIVFDQGEIYLDFIS